MCNIATHSPVSNLIQHASAGCTIVSSLLSLLGAFVIFWSYWKVSSVRNFARKLLTCLTVADFMIASGNLVGATDFLFNYANGTVTANGSYEYVCNAQSFITTFASMASFFWTLVITAHMMSSIQFQTDRTKSAVLTVLYHVICWGIPGLITVIADAHRVLGRNDDINTAVAGTWCWIKTNDDEIKWMVFTGKGWEILCYILSLSILVLLKLKLYLSRRRLNEIEQDFRDEDTHFLYLWLVLWLLRVWGTIRFLLRVFCKDDGVKFLIILQSIGDSGQAFGNCVLFCFLDKEVAMYIKRACIPCKFRGEEEDRLIATAAGSANKETETS